MPLPATNDWLLITPEPFSTQACVDFVTSPLAGGVTTFQGTTRAESNAAGQSLVALDYQAYEEMAAKQLWDLAERARQRWPILKLAILHRIGQVSLGQPSVIIAVSTPHRAESFEACRWIIDELKKEVAIWKKEIWSDGTGSWVHP